MRARLAAAVATVVVAGGVPVAGAAWLAHKGGPSVTVEHTVLDLHASGAWSGDIRSPRSLYCSDDFLNVRWVGTLGDRIVQLELFDAPDHHQTGTVHVGGGTTGGATMDPSLGRGAPDEGTIAATLTDAMSTEEHFLGGTIMIAGDWRSGSVDLRDAELRLTGSWRC